METIGDAYMVAAGLLDTSVNHAEAVANMAFGMRDAAKYVVKPATEEPLQVGDVGCEGVGHVGYKAYLGAYWHDGGHIWGHIGMMGGISGGILA